MTEKKEWKRPQDVVTFRTSDPKEMLGKYMPKHAVKTWTEDFRDEDTGEVVSIERNQIVVERGYISQEKLAEIQFAIQAGDIADVEVSEDDVRDMQLYTPAYHTLHGGDTHLLGGHHHQEPFRRACSDHPAGYPDSRRVRADVPRL